MAAYSTGLTAGWSSNSAWHVVDDRNTYARSRVEAVAWSLSKGTLNQVENGSLKNLRKTPREYACDLLYTVREGPAGKQWARKRSFAGMAQRNVGLDHRSSRMCRD